MDKDNIKIFGSSNELTIGFAEIFCNKIDSLLTEKKTINIALSGGNTPIELFKILAANYKDKIKWNNINFYWVDERCVPVDSPESNYGNADKYLFSKISINDANMHRIKGEDNPLNEAAKYSGIVIANVTAKNFTPCFDIILLGIGEDGHTASIFTDQMDLLTSDNIYDVSVHPKTGQKRITMTGKVINNADWIYFLVSGKSKFKVIADILNSKPEAKQYPVNYIKNENDNLSWYLDSDAAAQLNN